MDTSVILSGLALSNPVIPASGTFGYGYEFAEWYDINLLGSFSFKGTTKEPRFGNPTPRIAECENGLINAVGLQNPGVEKVISEELPKLAKCFSKPVIANVSGFSVEEYRYTCEKLDKEEQGRASRGQCQLPERARRRHELRHIARKRGGGHTCRQRRDQKAGLHQAFAKRDRHCVYRQSLRRRRCGRNFAYQYTARYADRLENKKAGHRQ